MSREKGREYEKLAEKFLLDNNYHVLERNWTAGHKEIDLIARKDNTIVFVEVKGGGSKKYGHPSGWVDRRKRNNLISAAEQYIIAHDYRNYDYRFDLITFYEGKLEHYRDAFQREE